MVLGIGDGEGRNEIPPFYSLDTSIGIHRLDHKEHLHHFTFEVFYITVLLAKLLLQVVPRQKISGSGFHAMQSMCQPCINVQRQR